MEGDQDWGRQFRASVRLHSELKIGITLQRRLVAALYLARQISLAVSQDHGVVPPAEEYDLVYHSLHLKNSQLKTIKRSFFLPSTHEDDTSPLGGAQLQPRTLSLDAGRNSSRTRIRAYTADPIGGRCLKKKEDLESCHSKMRSLQKDLTKCLSDNSHPQPEKKRK